MLNLKRDTNQSRSIHAKFLSSKWDYLLTILIIAILFFIICAVKNIFPFGTARIDTSDFEQESVPAYYHLWDVLHEKADLFF